MKLLLQGNIPKTPLQSNWLLGHTTNNLPLALKPIDHVSHTHFLKMAI